MIKEEKAIELLNTWVSKEFSRRKSDICLFPGCLDASIGSHSITERRILKRIAVDDHVYYYSNQMDIDKIGTRKVSVFGGFCNEYDSKLFDLIDNYDYINGNKKTRIFILL